MRYSACLAAATATVVLIGLAGCGDARLGELNNYIADVKQRRAPPLDPVPQMEQIDNFIYDPDGRRSPFVMDQRSVEEFAPTPVGSGLAPDPLRRKEVLEQYPLDALRMVGTLSQQETMWALVVSPDGILHRVTVGNFMGRNHGRVTSISQQNIQLTELVNEGVNEWVERQASIALRQ